MTAHDASSQRRSRSATPSHPVTSSSSTPTEAARSPSRSEAGVCEHEPGYRLISKIFKKSSVCMLVGWSVSPSIRLSFRQIVGSTVHRSSVRWSLRRSVCLRPFHPATFQRACLFVFVCGNHSSENFTFHSKKAGRLAASQTARQPDSQTARQPDSQAGRQTVRQADRQSGRQAGR